MSDIPPPNVYTPEIPRSWIEYGNLKIDVSKFLIGEGFLETGEFVTLIGFSYVGKSVFLTQWSILSAIGKSMFGIESKRPLRWLFVQAEDSHNKCIKMGRMYKRMNLTPDEVEQVHQNTIVHTLRGVQGKSAIAKIREFADSFNPDIICLNPLQSFCPDLYKDETLNSFLRMDFQPMLRDLKSGGVIAQHTPKPAANRNPSELSVYEIQYLGAGMACITNATRGNLVLLPVEGDVFRLAAGKGFEELGRQPDQETFIRRTKDARGIMLWEECNEEQAESAKESASQRKDKQPAGSNGSNGFVEFDRLLKILSPNNRFTREQIRQIVKRDIRKSQSWSDDCIKQLVHENKLRRTTIKNSKGGRFAFFSIPTPLEPGGDFDEDE